MGYALAKSAVDLGAEVVLISGPTNLEIPTGVKEFVQVRSAQEMYDETIKRFSKMDIAIACAAVADYKPKYYSNEK